jgi:hypothetical protein
LDIHRKTVTANVRIRRPYIALSILFASLIPRTSAQIRPDADFADLIRTPSGIQRSLEHCDGHPDFETALANWLEMAEPSSPRDRQAVRETSLRLLEDTTDRQLVLALSDGLLRHALEDIKRDQSIVPEALARALYADIRKTVKDQSYKAKAVAAPAYGLAENGATADERRTRFLEEVLNLAEPGVAHLTRPSQRQLGKSVGAGREQGDGASAAKRSSP